MGVEFLPSLHMGVFLLIKPCGEALIADLEDQPPLGPQPAGAELLL